MHRYDFRINGTDKTFNCTPQYMHWLNVQALKNRNIDIPCTRKEIEMFFHELNNIFQMLDSAEQKTVFENLKIGDAFVLV
jgi:hypothetical protein